MPLSCLITYIYIRININFQTKNMTSKEFVKSRMPNAKAEKHKTRGSLSKTYWLIRDGKLTMWFASGNSESNAWVNAKKRIKEDESEKSK